MNNNLAIFIPTYNRPKILKSNLVNIINQAQEFEIPVYVSDDSNNKETKIIIEEYMKNYNFQEKKFQISDPVESYFECITTCDIRDGRCISRCVEILKQNDN